jgi:hypothetical protein
VLPEESAEVLRREGDGIHMMFNFWVNQHLFYALATGGGHRRSSRRSRRRATSRHTAQWAHFLRNHDELDLGRLTDEQRQKVFARFGPEKTCSSTTAASAAASRRCSATGAARAGLQPDVLAARHPGDPLRRRDRHGRRPSLEERDAVRTPMQWSDEPTAASHRRRDRAPGDRRGPSRLRARQRRGAAARPRLAAELDGRDDPAAQGVPRDRLGRLADARDRLPARAGDALRLARQHARLR